MRLSRLYLPPPLQDGQELVLPRERAHYLATVLRLRPGAVLTVFDGTGGELPATVSAAERRRVVVRLGERRDIERESHLRLTVALGIARGERMGYALQKAVELGVTRIVPLLTERVTARLGADRLRQRAEHWRGVLAGACEQCGRNRVPVLEEVTLLSDWLADARRGTRLVLSPRATAPLSGVPHTGGWITLLTGPEGGLSAGELDLAEDRGYRPVSLGPRVLRAETAVLAAVTVAQTLWGDLGAGDTDG